MACLLAVQTLIFFVLRYQEILMEIWEGVFFVSVNDVSSYLTPPLLNIFYVVEYSLSCRLVHLPPFPIDLV